ncbi:trypsin-like peptidase domain-containing protein [Aliiroseovarius sp. 2305UL8-7]|uniref:trypsin-like peptidase domain-containing protein n=1 Tax=Aliiroseovarius conchicola TaxID=3121637 RepID=UPI0035276E42
MSNFEVVKVLTKIPILCLVVGFCLVAPAHAQQSTPRSAMVFFWAEDVENPGATNWRPLGSGFLVSDQGVVLTAKHVIESLVTGERIIGSISSKSTFPVPIDETDIQCAMANRDACAVRIPSGAIPPSVDQVFDVECTDLPLDTKLRALGFVGGGDQFGGVIQPRGEVVGAAMRAGLIPTDLDLVPTMSGGPVLNDRGNVVAIVKGADSTSDNLTFVTPITSIKPILESLNVQCKQEIVQSEDQTQESVDEELAGTNDFIEKFAPNRVAIGLPRLLTTGPRSNCATAAEIVSAQEAYSYVSSITNQSCTNYVNGTYRPYDPKLVTGESIEFQIFVERSGTTPNDGNGDFEEYSDQGEPLGRPFGIGLDSIPKKVKLRNNHVYFFELNSQVNLYRSPGTNKISIRFERVRHDVQVRTCTMSSPASGVNYSGNNLRTVPNVSSAEDCAEICHSDGLCNAWGWRKPGGHIDDNSCWIKSAASQLDENVTVVSGVKECS